ncbi:Na+:solute symporter [Candidatus Sumerlaeota bacterium]|nr:Na+:solute symporter [Candidatus Sumerlaeota bacterium]
MSVQMLDWIIVVAILVVCFSPALFFGRRAGKNSSEFFASGRSVPWWLAGISMVATTFSSDTPNLVTDIVRRQGVAGNWCWWAFLLSGIATVFFYAQLWRRSGVLTDLEFYEVRYSGKAASFVRGFRSIYLGLFFNCIIMATVCLAACKIAAIMFGLERWQTLLAVGLLNVVFAALSGLWGVLVVDMIQFFIMMTSVIAAAYFAVNLPEVGGLSAMIEKLQTTVGPDGINYLNMLPDFTNNWDLAMAIFIMPIAVQWWATWYPGGEPGGGSYIAQRMLASKSEKDALKSVLFFNVAHIVLRPWPWILVALASLIVYPQLGDIAEAFPVLKNEPALLGHDIAYPAMLFCLPVGFMGLMIGGLICANSSTMLTHLNWGASYLVHDFYRRFLKPNETEKHYVMMGRWATVLLFFGAAGMVYLLDTAKDAFDVILQIGAGTGLIYLLRWFWWRINAWCEVTAMVSSFLISVAFLVLNKLHYIHTAAPELCEKCKTHGICDIPYLSTDKCLLITVVFTTACWLITAWLTPQTDKKRLVEFYKTVRPFGPGWTKVREEAGISREEAAMTRENIPMALLGWMAGVSMVLTALFAVGNLLYGRIGLFWVLTAVCCISIAIVGYVLNQLWNSPTGKPTQPKLSE